MLLNQDCAVALQQEDDWAFCIAAPATHIADANVNPATGLATDYLNHFHEAIMLLDLIASCPDCREDLRAWQPRSYREHFRHSRFLGRDMAIIAYDTADPEVRDYLDTLTRTMTTVIEYTRSALATETDTTAVGIVAERASAWLKLLAVQAGAVINGQRDAGESVAPQATTDRVMQRIA